MWCVVALGAAACGDNLAGPVDDPAPIDGAVTRPDAEPQTLMISPATQTLDVELPAAGAPPTLAFTARLGDTDVTGTAAWTLALPDLGAVNAGVVQPSLLRGGEAELTATVGDQVATARVRINLHLTIDPDGMAAGFDDVVDPADPLAVTYPFDGLVVPRNLAAPDVHWTAGTPDTIMRQRWTEAYATVTRYVGEPADGVATTPAEAWTLLTRSGAGASSDPIAFELQRSGGGVVTQTWHVAQGDLPGLVTLDRVPVIGACDPNVVVERQRLDGSAPSVVGQGGCHGCHSTSRDGRRVAYTIDTAVPFPLVVADVGSAPLTYVPGFAPAATIASGTFSAFAPGGDRLLFSDDDASGPAFANLQLADLEAGTILNPDVMGAACGEPDWSPDGSAVAAICDVSGGGWLFDSTGGALKVGTWSAVDDTVIDVVVPRATAAQLGNRPTYPSFSPDSAWIAVGATDVGSRSVGSGALWLVGRDAGDPVELAAAAAGAAAFYPSFAPVRAGGYYWVAFTRRGPHGNLLAADAKQIWLAAIDETIGAVDPSHPPVYLGGQSTCGAAEGIKFVRDVCQDAGAACATGIDCCGGSCVDGTCGDDPAACQADGNACATAGDCCTADATCTDGYCVAPFPS